MEQLMIQSVANIQLDAFKKRKLFEIPLETKNIVNSGSKKLQCFQFGIANIDISFKKNQAQFSIFYKDMPEFVEKADTNMCNKFIDYAFSIPNLIH
jgi:hypothetical protein